MTHIMYVELLNKVFSLDEICYPEFPMAFPSRLRGEILSYAANLGDHPIMSCRFLGPLMMYRNLYICVDATNKCKLHSAVLINLLHGIVDFSSVNAFENTLHSQLSSLLPRIIRCHILYIYTRGCKLIWCDNTIGDNSKVHKWNALNFFYLFSSVKVCIFARLNHFEVN